jgi:hypothetical protein
MYLEDLRDVEESGPALYVQQQVDGVRKVGLSFSGADHTATT